MAAWCPVGLLPSGRPGFWVWVLRSLGLLGGSVPTAQLVCPSGHVASRLQPARLRFAAGTGHRLWRLPGWDFPPHLLAPTQCQVHLPVR